MVAEKVKYPIGVTADIEVTFGERIQLLWGVLTPGAVRVRLDHIIVDKRFCVLLDIARHVLKKKAEQISTEDESCDEKKG